MSNSDEPPSRKVARRPRVGALAQRLTERLEQQRALEKRQQEMARVRRKELQRKLELAQSLERQALQSSQRAEEKRLCARLGRMVLTALARQGVTQVSFGPTQIQELTEQDRQALAEHLARHRPSSAGGDAMPGMADVDLPLD